MFFDLICNDNSFSENEKVVYCSSFVNCMKNSFFVHSYYNCPIPYKESEDGVSVGLYTYDEAKQLLQIILSDLYFVDIYSKCLKYIKNREVKRRRLSKYISSMFHKYEYIYFLTYSFSDKDLSLKFESRRKKVYYFLKCICNSYALNVDYGSINGREHYHAVIGCNSKINYKTIPSNIDLELIPFVDDSVKLSNYITKLSYHGVKCSTKNKNICYWSKK